MKNILILIFILLTPAVLHAQLNERVVEGHNELSIVSNYPDTWADYIGEDVIFLPLDLNYSDLNHVYDCFFEDVKCKKPYKDTVSLSAEFIENKKFKIFGCDANLTELGDNAIIFQMYNEDNDVLFWKIPFLSKIFSVSNNYAKFMYSEQVNTRLPIVLDSFIKYYKSFVGKKFYAKRDMSCDEFGMYRKRIINLKTGGDCDIEGVESFICIDLSLMACSELYKQPFLIFRNVKGAEIAVSIMPVAGYSGPSARRLSINDFVSEKMYKNAVKSFYKDEHESKVNAKFRKEKYVLLYGEDFGKLVASNKVSIGMTCEMCLESLGNPYAYDRTIDEDSFYEIWEYRNEPSAYRFLYFKNGELVKIEQKYER